MTRGIRADLGLAWRNIWRHKTRTTVTGMAIALSLALQFFSYGTADYSYEKMEHAAVKTAGGSVLIHARGYWKAQTSKHIVARPDAIVAAVNSLPHVTGTVTKVILTGLLSTTRGNRGTKIVGVYPESEAQLDDRSRFIEEGSFLESSTVGSGRRARPPIVLGKSVVADLKLALGAKVKVTCTAPDGEVVHALFRLGGIMDSSKAMDEAAPISSSRCSAIISFWDCCNSGWCSVDDPTQRHTVTAAVKRRFTVIWHRRQSTIRSAWG